MPSAEGPERKEEGKDIHFLIAHCEIPYYLGEFRGDEYGLREDVHIGRCRSAARRRTDFRVKVLASEGKSEPRAPTIPLPRTPVSRCKFGVAA